MSENQQRNFFFIILNMHIVRRIIHQLIFKLKH